MVASGKPAASVALIMRLHHRRMIANDSHRYREHLTKTSPVSVMGQWACDNYRATSVRQAPPILEVTCGKLMRRQAVCDNRNSAQAGQGLKGTVAVYAKGPDGAIA